MHRTSIRRFLPAIMLASLLIGAPATFAQETAPETAPAAAPTYLYGDATADILVADLVGFGVTFSSVGLNFLVGAIAGSDGTVSTGDQILASAVTELGSINLFAFQSPDALPLTVAGTLLLGGEYLAIENYGLYSREQQWFYWAKNNLAMFKAYDAYASIRQRSSAWDNSSFSRKGVYDLLKEPFNLKNYGEPLLWGSVGLTLASIAASWAVSDDPLSTSPFTTGQWYLDNQEYTPAGYWLNHTLYFLSANTLGAIGEEGVFRGVFHEELTARLGRDAALAIDTGAFAAMHLVTDIARGMRWDRILIHVAGVSLSNLLFDLAYEKGGLPLAVAVHAASNFAGNILSGMLSAGVPLNRGTN